VIQVTFYVRRLCDYFSAWNWAGGEELNMLISIDAIRYGAGYDAAGHWHEGRADVRSAAELEQDEKLIAPARGAIYGILLSSLMWVGLLAAMRGLLALIQ
jgi:hypothetical protein